MNNYFTNFWNIGSSHNSFKNGIHPPDNKSYSAGLTIEKAPLPKDIFIPLHQHIGVPCIPLVKKGDKVKTGQVIAASSEFLTSPIHSSISGTVKAIGKFRHFTGQKTDMIHIIAGENEERDSLKHISNWQNATAEQLLEIIKKAGIVGLGGAAFPTHIKLSPPKDKHIDTLILNGCECEPFLTADHQLMLEFPEEILTGIDILKKILNVEKCFIGIENNKPDAIESLIIHIQKQVSTNTVVSLKTKYPQGAEKSLIYAILNRKVPPGALPMEVGVVVQNIGTALAVFNAVIKGESLIERVISITGPGITTPKNVLARIGTPIKDLIDFCGGINEKANRIISGGPMMGFSLCDLNSPVVKATSGIVVTMEADAKREEQACISCGACVSVCPMFLLPTELVKAAKYSDWEMADSLGMLNCIECGCCSYECPSAIPIVHWIKIGKYTLRTQSHKKSS